MAVGTDVFASFLYVDVPFLPPDTKLIHLDSNYWEIEKSYPTEVGMMAAPAAGLARLGRIAGRQHDRRAAGSAGDAGGHPGGGAAARPRTLSGTHQGDVG